MSIMVNPGRRLLNSSVWQSVFRSGTGDSALHRSLLIYNNLLLHVHPVKIRRRTLAFRTTFYLGGISILLFIILVATGILLMFYYRPSVPEAYQDMKDLQFVITSGTFIRNMHRWAAHGMVAVVFLHMLRVFFARAYRPPRQFNWVVGVFLLIGTLLLSYTGYLLPWDQLAYWAVSVGTNMAGYAPLLGQQIRFNLLGGHQIGPNALIRFYVLHCVVLPAVLTWLAAVHLWRIRKDGGLAEFVDKEPK
jgi:quinol-cytochrome oxidoreductase complex cytochrome b subunit